MERNQIFRRLYRAGGLLGVALLLLLVSTSCTEGTLDYEHPDVDVFVKQLKDGSLSVQSPDGVSQMPKFTPKDIGELLDYADDLSVIPSFPLAPVSYSAGGKLRLGECLLWTVETIRLGHNASMGEEVQDAVARYRHWWENRKYPRTMWTIDPCWNEPLCGSGYMWW